LRLGFYISFEVDNKTEKQYKGKQYCFMYYIKIREKDYRYEYKISQIKVEGDQKDQKYY
jgi:hypothetical protein